MKNKEEFMKEWNEMVILQAKGFNHSVDTILKEIALLKKDNNFLLSLLTHKLKITEEEIKKYANYFDTHYPKEKVEEYLEQFKMKIYDKDGIKKILGIDTTLIKKEHEHVDWLMAGKKIRSKSWKNKKCFLYLKDGYLKSSLEPQLSLDFNGNWTAFDCYNKEIIDWEIYDGN